MVSPTVRWRRSIISARRGRKKSAVSAGSGINKTPRNQRLIQRFSGIASLCEPAKIQCSCGLPGICRADLVSGANRHDSKMFKRCVDAIPAIADLGGRPRKRPSKLHADKGYDYKHCRAHLRQRGIASGITRRGVESSERLGKHRWVVERTHGWFEGFGKMQIRFEL